MFTDENKPIRAKVKPRPEQVDNYTRIPTDIVFNFIYAYTLDDGEVFYEPMDKLYPCSDPVNMKDLSIIEEKEEKDANNKNEK